LFLVQIVREWEGKSPWLVGTNPLYTG
jgi:hypothetical protein